LFNFQLKFTEQTLQTEEGGSSNQRDGASLVSLFCGALLCSVVVPGFGVDRRRTPVSDGCDGQFDGIACELAGW